MASSNHQHQPRIRLALFVLLVLGFSNEAFGLYDQPPKPIWGSNKRIFSVTQQDTSNRKHDKIQVRDLDAKNIVVVGPAPKAFVAKSRTHPKENGSEDRTHGQRRSPHIIIIGGPASGKGTQCERIAGRYGVVHLSTGDMLREAVKAGTEVGRIAKGYMDRGELVPDEVIIAIVDARLKQPDCMERGWLLDGFPRTKAQAEHLVSMGIRADITLLLNVRDDELIERVVGRRTDPVTGKIYHLKFRPPPADVVDRLEQRSDDTYESIGMRLRQFHNNLSQIKSFLDDSIVMVDGHGSPDIVAKRIAKSIDKKVRSKLLV